MRSWFNAHIANLHNNIILLFNFNLNDNQKWNTKQYKLNIELLRFFDRLLIKIENVLEKILNIIMSQIK